MESIHLVALDSRIQHEIVSLNSMAICPKLNHAFYCVLIGKTKWPYCLYLCLEPIFVFLFFSKLELLNIIFWPSPSLECHLALLFGLGPTYLIYTLRHRVSQMGFIN